MKKTIWLCCFILMNCMLHAQRNVEYDIINSGNKDEVIYKGSCSFVDLLNVKAFTLAEQAENYQPDEDKTDLLTAVINQYQLIIFLGTWCEDSHRMIPQLYRVLNATGYHEEQMEMYALDRDKKGKDGSEKKYNITNVPTVIVLKNGKEIGRITETVKESIEGDLLEIMK